MSKSFTPIALMVVCLGFINTSGAQCTNPDVPTITVPSSVCKGDTLHATIASGSLNDATDWTWYADGCGSSGTLLGTGLTLDYVPTGTFTIFVRGEGGCVGTAGSCTSESITVVEIKPNLGTDQQVCNGSITLDAGAGMDSYSWSNGSVNQNINVNTTGVYAVTVTNGGCSGSDTVSIEVDELTVDLGPDQTVCNTNVFLSAGSGADTYTWSNGASSESLTITPSDPTGAYSVTVTKGSCTVSDTVEVNIIQPQVDLGSDTNVCGSTSLSLDAGTADSYSWNSGETTQTITISSAGSYAVTVTQSGCTASDQISVTFDSIEVDLGGDIFVCNQNFVELDAGPANRYTWSTTETTQTIQISTSGVYSVSIQKDGCTDQDTVEVVFQELQVELGDEIEMCGGDSTLLEPTGDTYQTISWSNGAVTPTITVDTFGTFSVQVTQGGCTAADSVAIVKGESCPEDEIFIPDAFSPNGDGNNDFFLVHANEYESITVSVYDRWGHNIFTTTEIQEGWDGTRAGFKLSSGTYAYVVKVSYLSGESKLFKGDFTLLR